jgi:hypothetical protein
MAAGNASVGEGADKRSVELSTFYIDQKPVTADAFQACVAAKACIATEAPKVKGEAILLDYERAERYCAFAGKRLPSEFEWEDARGQAFSSNTVEWTGTWFASSLAECAGKCSGKDPLGPCDGAPFCSQKDITKKVLKGGASAAWREGANPGKRAAVRCATSTSYLTRFPPHQLTVKRAPPPAIQPPTAEQLRIFNDVTEDKLDTQVCEKKGRAFIDCRDPNHYIKTNEPKQQVWVPYVENVGGGYTGVGIDQNYNFVALAHSEWAWLFDYDPTVVKLHWVLRAMILDSANRDAFIEHFQPKNLKQGMAVLEEAYKDHPEKNAFKEVYQVAMGSLLSYYKGQMTNPVYKFTWLGTEDHYQYIRLMYQQGRMRSFKGNMLDKNTMTGIGEAARKLGVTIRIYYPSNAPECWKFTKQYKSNVLGLPFDDQSIVLQTVSGGMRTGFGQTGYWHYNVQLGKQQQSLIEKDGYTVAKQLLYNRIKTDQTDLTLTGLPSD